MPTYATDGEDLAGTGVILAVSRGAGTLDKETGVVTGTIAGGNTAGIGVFASGDGTDRGFAIEIEARCDFLHSWLSDPNHERPQVGFGWFSPPGVTAGVPPANLELTGMWQVQPPRNPPVTEVLEDPTGVGPVNHRYLSPFIVRYWRAVGWAGLYCSVVTPVASNTYWLPSPDGTSTWFANRDLWFLAGVCSGIEILRIAAIRTGDASPSLWEPTNRQEHILASSQPANTMVLSRIRGKGLNVRIFDIGSVGAANTATIPIGAAFNDDTLNEFAQGVSVYTVSAGNLTIPVPEQVLPQTLGNTYYERNFRNKTFADTAAHVPIGVHDLDMVASPGSTDVYASPLAENEVREHFFSPENSGHLYNGGGYTQAFYVNSSGVDSLIGLNEIVDWTDPDTDPIGSEKLWVLLFGGNFVCNNYDQDGYDMPVLVSFSRRPKKVELRKAGLYVEMPKGEILGWVGAVKILGTVRVQRTDDNDTCLNLHHIQGDLFHSNRWNLATLSATVKPLCAYWHPRNGFAVVDTKEYVKVSEGATKAAFPGVVGWEQIRTDYTFISLRDHYTTPDHSTPYVYADGTNAIKSVPLASRYSLALSSLSHINGDELAPVVWESADNAGVTPTVVELATHLGGFAHMVDISNLQVPADSTYIWTPGADMVRRADAVADTAEIDAQVMALGGASIIPYIAGDDTQANSFNWKRLATPSNAGLEGFIWRPDSEKRAELRKVSNWLNTDALNAYVVHAGDAPPGLNSKPRTEPSGAWDMGEVDPWFHLQYQDHQDTVGDDLKLARRILLRFASGMALAFQTPSDVSGQTNMAREFAGRTLGAWNGTDLVLPLSAAALELRRRLIRYGVQSVDYSNGAFPGQAWATAEWSEIAGIGAALGYLAYITRTSPTPTAYEEQDFAGSCKLAGDEIVHLWNMVHAPEVLWRSGCYYERSGGNFGPARQDGGVPQQPGTRVQVDVGVVGPNSLPGWDADTCMGRDLNGKVYQATEGEVGLPVQDNTFGVPDSLFHILRFGENHNWIVRAIDRGITPDGFGGWKERRWTLYDRDVSALDADNFFGHRAVFGWDSPVDAGSGLNAYTQNTKRWNSGWAMINDGYGFPRVVTGDGAGYDWSHATFTAKESSWGRFCFYRVAGDSNSTPSTSPVTIRLPVYGDPADVYQLNIGWLIPDAGTPGNPVWKVNGGAAEGTDFVAGGIGTRKPYVTTKAGVTADANGEIVLTYYNPDFSKQMPHIACVELVRTSPVPTGGCLVDVWAVPVPNSNEVGGAGWINLASNVDLSAPDNANLYAKSQTYDFFPTASSMMLVVAPHVDANPALSASRPVGICGLVFENVDGSNTWVPNANASGFTGCMLSDVFNNAGGGITSGCVADPGSSYGGDNQFRAKDSRPNSSRFQNFAARRYFPLHMREMRRNLQVLAKTKMPGRHKREYWRYRTQSWSPFNASSPSYWPSSYTEAVTGLMESSFYPATEEDFAAVHRADWAEIPGMIGVGSQGYDTTTFGNLSLAEATAIAFSVRPAAWGGTRPRVDLWAARPAQSQFYLSSPNGYSSWGQFRVGESPPPKVVAGFFSSSFLPANTNFFAGNAVNRFDVETGAGVASGPTITLWRHYFASPVSSRLPGNSAASARARNQHSHPYSLFTGSSFYLGLHSLAGVPDAGKKVTVKGLGINLVTRLDQIGRAVELYGLPSGEALTVRIENGPTYSVPAQGDGANFTLTGIDSTPFTAPPGIPQGGVRGVKAIAETSSPVPLDEWKISLAGTDVAGGFMTINQINGDIAFFGTFGWTVKNFYTVGNTTFDPLNANYRSTRDLNPHGVFVMVPVNAQIGTYEVRWNDTFTGKSWRGSFEVTPGAAPIKVMQGVERTFNSVLDLVTTGVANNNSWWITNPSNVVVASGPSPAGWYSEPFNQFTHPLVMVPIYPPASAPVGAGYDRRSFRGFVSGFTPHPGWYSIPFDVVAFEWNPDDEEPPPPPGTPAPPEWDGVCIGNAIALTWPVLEGDVAGYRVWRDGVMIQDVGDVLSYLDEDVEVGNSYSYQIQAYDSIGGESPLSDASSFFPCNPPVTSQWSQRCITETVTVRRCIIENVPVIRIPGKRDGSE